MASLQEHPHRVKIKALWERMKSLEEQKKQRQLEGALELMKRGSEMLNPPKPRITCKYNAFTKTTVCN